LSRLFITTAIDYANAKPHLGHAYEKVLTDTLARFARRTGQNVRFLSGLDEHGQKVQQSAGKAGQSPQEFVDGICSQFSNLWKTLWVEPDDFLRTTQPRHKNLVAEVLEKLHRQGDIVKGTFKGFYSVRAEQFLTEKERQPDGTWPEIYGEVVELTEENYFFKLSKHQEWLRDLIQKQPSLIFPEFRAKELLGALEKPLPDLCISRPKTRLAWGIPLPFDENQVTYVKGYPGAGPRNLLALHAQGARPADVCQAAGSWILDPEEREVEQVDRQCGGSGGAFRQVRGGCVPLLRPAGDGPGTRRGF